MKISEETYQKITEELDALRRTNQELVRFGTEENRDILASRFETGIRGIQGALSEVEITI